MRYAVDGDRDGARFVQIFTGTNLLVYIESSGGSVSEIPSSTSDLRTASIEAVSHEPFVDKPGIAAS